MSQAIIKKKKGAKVYKNKKLNNAKFNSYNLNDYQVFLQLVSQIRGVDDHGEFLPPEKLEREHTLTAKDFSEKFNLPTNVVYRILRTASQKLATIAVALEKPDLFETWQVPICQYSVYNNKEGSLTIKFNESIMPYLAQVTKKFVLYNLREIANFGSLYTTRLYELIQEFKDTGYITKTVDELKHIFAVGNTYKLYADFKRKTFAHAVDEINSNYDMKLKFEETKVGRKVTSIKFTFKPTTIKKAFNPHTKNMCNVYKPPQAISTDKQSTLLETDNNVPTNTTTARPNTPPQKQTIDTRTPKERLTIDSMNKLLEVNPKMTRRDALKKAREFVGE
jgi:plasmid replication initiation protein